jgi:hypothetical protein
MKKDQMAQREVLTKWNFDTLPEFFESIIESYNVGQREEAARKFVDLSAGDKRDFLEQLAVIIYDKENERRGLCLSVHRMCIQNL